MLGAILNYNRVPMSTLKGPLVKQILTVAHMTVQKDDTKTGIPLRRRLKLAANPLKPRCRLPGHEV